MSERWHITLLAAGGATALDTWIDESSPGSDPFTWDLASWQRCTRRLVQRAQHDPGAEIAITTLTTEAPMRWDRDRLRIVLERARSSSWGAPIYLVVSRELQANELLVAKRKSVIDWLETARKERAAGLLQLFYDPNVEEPPDPAALRAAIDEAQAWQDPFFSAEHGSWGCVVSENRRATREFLGPMSIAPANRQRFDHMVLVAASSEPKAQTAFVRRQLLQHPQCQHLIATLEAEPREALKNLCREAGLPEPLKFRGDLELLFFLQRLNSRRSPVETLPSTGLVRAVPRDRDPMFEPSNNDLPSMLITSAFDPHLDDPVQAVEAAKDVGMLRGLLPDPAHLEVHQRILPEALLELVPKLRPPTVWVHLGHGHGPGGLEDAERCLVTPKRWLDCFAGFKGSLPLVVLLTCHSTETAEVFARAGAEVVVGFEGGVLSRQALLLAKPVVEAALSRPGDWRAILQEFEVARRHLEAVESISRPVAYYCTP